jgi:hypothetical protein
MTPTTTSLMTGMTTRPGKGSATSTSTAASRTARRGLGWWSAGGQAGWGLVANVGHELSPLVLAH